ncbi:NAD-P-binding protein [Trametes polyzona]|nr:NAD-P-binding protein [Trametes polyzona]
MSSNAITIFLTGATGYIGGSILQRLLSHPNKKNFEITALVRNADKAKRLESEFGVKTVVGSLQDLDKLATLAENAHVVIHTADCDDVDAIKAILRGLKARHEKTGDLPLLIHTSGLAEVGDDSKGESVNEKVWSDLNIPDIESLPPTAPHRPVDLLVVAADQDGYVRSHIVLPGYIYGVAKGPLFDAGISNAYTILTPLLSRIALQHGKVAVLNKGVSVWANVHIDDVTDLYLQLFDTLLTTPEKVSHGRDGYFFGANGEASLVDTLKVFAEVLHSEGRIPSPEVVNLSLEEMAKYYGNEFLARVIFSNTRSQGERARREIGWAPKHTAKELFEGLPAELRDLLKKEDENKKA